VLPKKLLLERLPRRLSNVQLRKLVTMVNRAIDPDAPFNDSETKR